MLKMKFCQEGKRRFSDDFAEKIFQKQRVWRMTVNVFIRRNYETASAAVCEKVAIREFFRRSQGLPAYRLEDMMQTIGSAGSFGFQQLYKQFLSN